MRRFGAGDIVRVRAEDAAVRWRKPHLRTPGYLFGLFGTIERDCVVRPTWRLSAVCKKPLSFCVLFNESLDVWWACLVSASTY